MPRTRQSTRSEKELSISTTPSTVVSSLSSSKTSVQSSTPLSSDLDEDVVKPAILKRRPTAPSAGNKMKRALDIDSEVVEDSSRNPRKRRILTHTAYVEIPLKSVNTNLTKKRKDKGKAPANSSAFMSEVTSEVQEEDFVEVDELEYGEDISGAEDSADSGSEFKISDDSAEFVEGSQDEDDIAIPSKLISLACNFADDAIADEDIMMDAAVRLSLQAARDDRAAIVGSSTSGASSSNSRASVNRAALIRAAAAERRVARLKQGVADVDEFVPESDSEAEFSSSDSEPLIGTKGKGKMRFRTKGASSAAPAHNSKSKNMTLAEVRRKKRGARSTANANKVEESALRHKLGRLLTLAEKSTVALHKHHPELVDVWGDLERDIVVAVPENGVPPSNLKVTLLPFQLESLHWMKVQEKGIWSGGLLADEMGMGKTIQMISLLCFDAGAKPNLVVAPTVAVMQWRNEIEAHSEGLSVLVWHGSSRETDIKELKKYDVVLTTYAVLESCFRKQQSGFKRKGKIVKEKSVMHQIKWNRIILDESHNIKERATNTAKATFELQAKYRWCLSGTPLQNRVGELYSMIRFLGGDPFSYYFCKSCDCKSLHWKFSDKRTCDDCGHSPMKHTCFWNNEILTPIQKNGMLGPGQVAFKKLKILLDRMMLRRTKIQRADDLGLPPRTVVIRRDYFSPEEKELYQSLFSDAKRQFSTYVDSGTILNNYSNIFSLLTRMRQMACHPDLVLRSKTNSGTFLKEDLGEATVCRLCNDIAEDAIQAKCRHIFDRECIKQYLNTAIETTPACPVCHIPLTIDLEAPALDLEENSKTRQGILGRLDLDKWRSSSKIEALIEELSNLRKQDATTKSIVFSQFVNFLDLIAYRLQRVGFTICRLEGTMSPQARDATIKHFMNNVHVTVFLVSLKAGGVALNLTEASRVYLMDSWWNPAVEYQAMDRIHRLGQHRPVQAIKLVVEDSIESRIIQLQEKKAAMVNATLSTDDSAMGRLTPEDLGFLFRM